MIDLLFPVCKEISEILFPLDLRYIISLIILLDVFCLPIRILYDRTLKISMEQCGFLFKIYCKRFLLYPAMRFEHFYIIIRKIQVSPATFIIHNSF